MGRRRSRSLRRAARVRVCASIGFALGSPILRRIAFFESSAAFSRVPPMPTPTTSGGHGFGPADSHGIHDELLDAFDAV